MFDGLGGELNAATAKEYTVLYARVLDAHLETALDVMSDMLLAPSFDPDELAAEREVVLEEIAMYEDSYHDLAHDLIAEAVFAGHPLGRPVIGTADAIRGDGRRGRVATTTPTATSARTSSSPPPGNLEHEPLAHMIEQRFGLYAAPPRPVGRRPPGRGSARSRRRARFVSQGLRAVPRLPGRDRAAAVGPAPVRRLAARLDAGRLGVVAGCSRRSASGGGWPTRSTPSRPSTRTPA